jgi:hypothetical protein
MMGSYYENRAISPYSVGAIDQSMVDVASSTIQTLLSNAQALVTVIPWATEDDAAQWVQSLTPEVRYTLYPVTAQFLDAVTKAAFGQPVGFVAVLDTTMRAQPEQLFEGTPWKYFQSQAVFSERDPGEPPAIRFLYWANLRDEVSSAGTASTLEAKAKAAGATLVYPVTIPIQGAARGMPNMDFPLALASQTKTASASMTTPSAAPLPTGPGGPAAPAPTSSSSGWGAVVLLASVAGLGGYVAYRVARGR